MILCHNTTLTFDLEKRYLSLIMVINFPMCMILELTVHSMSCLQRFPTMWQYDLDLCPSTMKKQASFTHHGDQMCQVVRTWRLRFGLQGRDRWRDRRTERRTTQYHNKSRQRRANKNITLSSWFHTFPNQNRLSITVCILVFPVLF